MDQRESTLSDEITKDTIEKSSSISDIDQLCHLIDRSTFGGCLNRSSGKCSNNLSIRFRSVPSNQVKAFRSSRLKRLNGPSIPKIDEEDDDNDNNNNHRNSTKNDKNCCRSLIPYTRRTFSMRFSLSSPSSSLLNRFRSLSTCHFPLSRRRSQHLTPTNLRYSSPSTLTLFRTKSILPDIIEEETNHEQNSSTTQTQLSCTIVDTRRPTANSCNVEELAAYLDNFLYLPKSLSGAAELMYT